MLWLALHLPSLPLEAFCAPLPADQRARPVVLLHQHRVHSVNAVAAERGVQPGQRRATALALAADLLVAERCPQREAAALQAVAHAALAFTPAVNLQGASGVSGASSASGASGAHDTLGVKPAPRVQQGLQLHTVLLEVQASLRLFGGLPALCRRLAAAVAPLGHHVQMAAAPTAQGAALLAHWAPARVDLVHGAHARSLPALQTLLGAAPLALLERLVGGPGHADSLRGMGLHTLADLQALPREGLARRFGQPLLDGLDRALGLQPDPRPWLQAAPTFETRLELQARADNTDQVLHAAAVLLARLVAWAQARQGRVAAFTLCMLHERMRQAEVPATELKVELAEPALDPAHLQLLLRERLARCTLAAPTLELRLHCQHLVAAPAPNGELFPTRASQQEGLLRLLERLCARLGEDQVQRLVPVADHRPERASRSVPAQGRYTPVGAPVNVRADKPIDAPPAARASPGVPGHTALPLRRPAWLLPEPMPLAERQALPLLHGQLLQLVSGPERIESGWWDDHPVARDYFIAMAHDGSLAWVFRGRLPAQPGEVNWYLQGWFA
jgi:protein ImuB